MSQSNRVTPTSYSANALAGDLNPDTIFRCDGRDVRLERVHNNGSIELIDLKTLDRVQIIDPSTGMPTAPTIEWMREAYKGGMLYLVDKRPSCADERQRIYERLDPDACGDLDPKSVWRFRLAYRASKDSIKKTDDAAASWLSDNFGSEEGDRDFPCPAPSSLRRWIRDLEQRSPRTGSLVSLRGRRAGQSQLNPIVDALVHEAALWFWTRKRAKMIEAYAWLKERIAATNSALLEERRTPYPTPSFETLRKRIQRLRCHDTVLSKEGEKAAAKLYHGSGEGIKADRVLEICFMDATTLEQTIVFDDDWQLPACKVRVVALLDCATHAILACHPYAGPNRSETSMEAIIECMVPSDAPAEMMRDYPGLANIFGRPAAILPDNEKALIAPSSVPCLNEAGISVLLPPVEMPTAKAAIERFFRTLKEALASIPGTMIDPKRAKDLDYDAINSAALTFHQLRNVVAQVVASHNVSASKGLDGRSPLAIWTKKVGARVTPAFEEIADIRRMLGRTHEALLTTDGIELDGIRYRDAKSVEKLLNNMSSTASVRGQRSDGSATVRVKVRRCDGNIDTIDVFDTLTKTYVSLPSTQPEYTHKLSLWEHKEFKRQAQRRGDWFDSQEARLKSKAVTIRMIDELAPDLAFRQRRSMAALYMSTQLDSLCSGQQPSQFPSDAIITPQVAGDQFRQDDGFPPEDQASPPIKRQSKHKPPMRPQGYGFANSEIAPADFSWDDVHLDDCKFDRGDEAWDYRIHSGGYDRSEGAGQ
ncbi:MAG: integrase [Sphingomonadaceae bacterium]